MSAVIRSIEDHRNGEFRVDVNLNGRRAKFSSMMDAQKWINWMKLTGGLEEIVVNLKEIVIMAKRQIAYDSCYVM